MGRQPCFMAERTEKARVFLRRYAGEKNPVRRCEETLVGFHDAENNVAESTIPLSDSLEGTSKLGNVDKSDSRWPQHCICGYEFVPSDEWQLGSIRLYRTPDGRLFPSHELPPGAMFYAGWFAEAGFGEGLTVMLPDNTLWCVDGPASNAPGKLPGWAREGAPPLVTASPSIRTPGYHGFLRAGVLEEC